MSNTLSACKAGLAALGGVATYLWGPWDALLIVLIAVIALDYLTGILNAGVHGRLSSAVGFRGLLKKIAIFMMVALASLVDKLVPGGNSAVRAAVCTFYIANEGISILENAAGLGLPLPGILRKMLQQLGEEKEP